MTDQDHKALLQAVRSKLRITKVTATRSVKGRTGDNFAGFSAAWESVQDDSDTMLSDRETASQGMSMLEAKVAYIMLAREADLAAHEAAFVSGNISGQTFQDRRASIKTNYAKLLRTVVQAVSESDDE